MCNNCDCENYEKCSIVGYFPLGFCCPKCAFYEDREECFQTLREVEFSRNNLPTQTIIH